MALEKNLNLVLVAQQRTGSTLGRAGAFAAWLLVVYVVGLAVKGLHAHETNT